MKSISLYTVFEGTIGLKYHGSYLLGDSLISLTSGTQSHLFCWEIQNLNIIFCGGIEIHSV